MTNAELLWSMFVVHILAWFAVGKVVAMSNAARDAQVTLSMFGMTFAGAIGLLYVANSQEVTRFALNSMALSTGLAFYAAGIVASVIDDRG